ncbi:MAG: AAA family ATPase [Formosimonas sp.]
MLITKFTFENLYGFKDFLVDMTYPRVLKHNPIEHEYLAISDAFKVKRVCIIAGGNATGKTSVGKLLCAAQNIIKGRGVSSYIQICNKKKPAVLTMEFVQPSTKSLHEVRMEFKYEDFLDFVELSTVSHRAIVLSEKDTPGTARERLDNLMLTDSKKLEADVDLSKWLSIQIVQFNNDTTFLDTKWRYVLSEASPNNSDVLSRSVVRFDIKLASAILKTFDPTIKKLTYLDGGISRKNNPTKNYRIVFQNGDEVGVEIDQEDTEQKATNWKRLSKGTFEAIAVVDFIQDLVYLNDKGSTTLFLDERMAYVHTKIESLMLNFMIGKLNNESQLFYTTHNMDLLDMNLPIHSFLFLKRKQGMIEAIQLEHHFKKNDRSLRSFIRNDVLGADPDVSLMDALL